MRPPRVPSRERTRIWMTTSRIWTRGVRPVSGMLVTGAAAPSQCVCEQCVYEQCGYWRCADDPRVYESYRADLCGPATAG